MLLQALYCIRSEYQLMAQYNWLFRRFIGLAMDDAVWVPTVFTKNRERLIKHDAVIVPMPGSTAAVSCATWVIP